jgi:peptidoglycan hydrolase-like protein with peptidoglycan-binding domain
VSRARATDVFDQGDFGWDEPLGGRTAAFAAPAPALPTLPVRRRRRQPPRTLAGDLRRLRAAFPHAPSVPLGDSTLALLLAVAVVLAAGLVASRSGLLPGADEARSPVRRGQASAEPASEISPRPALAKSLQRGSTGPHVLGAQEALVVLGLTEAVPDGGYGDRTAAAVLDFQAREGLASDGVLGPATGEALRGALAEGARSDADRAIAGLRTASAGGRLPSDTVRAATRTAERAVDAVAALPLDRAAYVAAVLQGAAEHGDVYNRARVLAIFGMAEANVEHLAREAPEKRDIVDADGIAYRFFPAKGYQFHPLAMFVRLNFLAKHGRRADAARLADAIVARGVSERRTLSWEYYFPFGGPSRWISGLAQAVGAQALARAAELTHDRRITSAAAAAYRAIPATLTRPLAGGLWVREYGYSDSAILNAQLQTIVSLSEYSSATGDGAAAELVAKLATAARARLARFDTGCWSLYMLDGSPASLAYHRYHVVLLRALGRATGEGIWVETAARWRGYLRAGGCA